MLGYRFPVPVSTSEVLPYEYGFRPEGELCHWHLHSETIGRTYLPGSTHALPGRHQARTDAGDSNEERNDSLAG
jgi:hypothetical protein